MSTDGSLGTSLGTQTPPHGTAAGPGGVTSSGAQARDAFGAKAYVVGFLLAASGGSVGVELRILSLSPTNILLGLALLVAFLGPRSRPVVHLRLIAFDGLALLYVVSSFLIEAYNSADLSHSFNKNYTLAPMFFLLAYVAARLSVDSGDEYLSFARGFLLPGIPVSLLGLLQIAGVGPVQQFLLTYVSDDNQINRLERGSVRATSTIGHWSALGGYLCCLLAIGAGALIYQKMIKGNVRDWALLVPLVVCITGVFSTLTFAAYVTAAIILLPLAWRLGIKASTMLQGSVLLGVLWFAGGSLLTTRLQKQTQTNAIIPESYRWLPESIGYRVVYWVQEDIPSWLQRPVSGWGQAAFKDSGGWPIRPANLEFASPESEWFKTLVVSGLLGFVAVLALIVGMLLVLRRSGAGAFSPSLAPARFLMAGLLVGAFIHPYFTNAGAPAVLWPLIGACAWPLNQPSSATRWTGWRTRVGRSGSAADLVRRQDES